MKAAVAQLAGDRPKDARPPRVIAGGDNDRSVLIEPDVAAVGPSVFFRGAHDDCRDHLALLDGAVRRGLLTEALMRSPTLAQRWLGAAHHADTHNLLGAGVVGDFEPRLWHESWLFSSSVCVAVRQPGSSAASTAATGADCSARRSDLDETPALVFAEGPGLLDAHGVAKAGVVVSSCALNLFVDLYVRR